MVIRDDIVPMVVVKFKVTTDSNHNLLSFENLQDQQAGALGIVGLTSLLVGNVLGSR